MAGIITHLAIANKIENVLPEGTVTNRGLFYLGSIAPDLISMREGVVRSDKKHSHLRTNITDMEFGKKENLRVFHDRVNNFINNSATKEKGLIDLYRGYVVHLLSDEMFLLKVRPDFVMQMDKLGIAPTDILFRDKILHDLDMHDFKLIRDVNEMEDICNILREVEPASVEGYITDKELKLGIDWVIDKNFDQKHEDAEPIYISYEKILDYIDRTAKDILNILSDGIMLTKMF